jgi:hypothetical protein
VAHDYAQQKAETLSAFSDLQAANTLPDVADLELFFLPAKPALDWQPLANALADLGFACEWIDADGDDPAALVAVMEDQPLSASSIWMIEELATRVAIEKGFTPDGWGFAAD